jgi:TRAP-type mannitol/chloroaromatic compound transport system substrate-binding protein
LRTGQSTQHLTNEVAARWHVVELGKYLVNTRQMESRLLHGGGIEPLQEVFTQFNSYGIPVGNTGAQMGGWFRKEINRIEDMQGLKFRIAGLAGRVPAKVGVVPQVECAVQAISGGNCAAFAGDYGNLLIGPERGLCGNLGAEPKLEER